MERKKHALVIFTKFPEPGVTKTRLIEENGGQLTPQEAADLYKAMVLDTANVGSCALDDCSRMDDLDGARRGGRSAGGQPFAAGGAMGRDWPH